MSQRKVKSAFQQSAEEAAAVPSLGSVLENEPQTPVEESDVEETPVESETLPVDPEPAVPPPDPMEKEPETPEEPLEPEATFPEPADPTPPMQTDEPEEPEEEETEPTPAVQTSGEVLLQKCQEDLDALMVDLDIKVRQLKKSEDDREANEIIRLGAAKFLREAKLKIEEISAFVDELETLTGELSAQQQSLDTAKEYIDERSATYRREREAFLHIKGMTDQEFYTLLANVRTKAA